MEYKISVAEGQRNAAGAYSATSTASAHPALSTAIEGHNIMLYLKRAGGRYLWELQQREIATGRREGGYPAPVAHAHHRQRHSPRSVTSTSAGAAEQHSQGSVLVFSCSCSTAFSDRGNQEKQMAACALPVKTQDGRSKKTGDCCER